MGPLLRRAAVGTAATVVATIGLPVLVTAGLDAQRPPNLTGLPARAVKAYVAVDDWCPRLRWELVAAVGEVESHHGTIDGRTIDPGTGVESPSIFGIPLDGTNGTQRLPIGRWDGWWGLTGRWERAVGPMQFRAPTFTAWGVDGDGDNVANPHDLDDAAASAANYLCGPEQAVTDERAALLRYNRSNDYVDQVLAIVDRLVAGPSSWRCPIYGPTSFTDTWGAPRPGGRSHVGVDMFAAYGTPIVAPIPGTVTFRYNQVGGSSFHLYGDDGTYVYGTHLAAYGPVDGPVPVGTVIGYVGTSGNAAWHPAAPAPRDPPRPPGR